MGFLSSRCLLAALLTAVVVALTTLPSCEASLRKLRDTNSNNGGSEEKYGKVMGYVVCDSCLEKNLTQRSTFLPGVTVSLTCQIAGRKPFFATAQRTDEQGRFSIDVPAQISSSGAQSSLCSARVANSLSSCGRIAPSNQSSPLTLHATIQGHRIFSTGPFVFTPRKPLASCSKKNPRDRASTTISTNKRQDSLTARPGFAEEKAPAFPNLPSFGNPLSFPPVTFPTFGGIPSSPASQFPVTSLFPPIPANPPPLLSQVPAISGGVPGFSGGPFSGFPGFSGGAPAFSGFPQLPNFQFPFFAAPPPPGN